MPHGYFFKVEAREGIESGCEFQEQTQLSLGAQLKMCDGEGRVMWWGRRRRCRQASVVMVTGKPSTDLVSAIQMQTSKSDEK